MDAFSKILSLANIEGILDLRCHMSGRFDLPHEKLAQGEAQFHLVLSGTARLEPAGEQALDLRAGDFVLLPRGDPHSVRGTGPGPAAMVRMDHGGPLPERRNTDGAADMDLLCGRFRYNRGTGALIMRSLPNVLRVSFAEDTPTDALVGIVALMRDEIRLLRPGALTIVSSLSQMLFIMAMRAYAERAGIQPSLPLLLADPRLSTAVLAMLNEPEAPWTVDTLAKRAHMSRATFARRFSEKGSLSPLDFLTTIRVQMASRLLEATDLPTGEIAARVGYQSESAFAKMFQKRTGLTPFGFRRAPGTQE